MELAAWGPGSSKGAGSLNWVAATFDGSAAKLYVRHSGKNGGYWAGRSDENGRGKGVAQQRSGGRTMKMNSNNFPENFLQKYRRGKPESVDYVPLTKGFLKLEYGLHGVSSQLSLVSFVLAASDDAIAIGPRLEINMLDDESDDGDVTYISENGVSGIQWSGGYATWGHTYDDDSPVPKGEKIELARWMDRCIAEMINPAEEEIAERIRLDKEDQ